MSNQIKQIQANYHPVEDRILFKIHTDNQQIFQAWITRRYLKLLMPVLQGQHPETGKPLMTDPESPPTEKQSSEEVDTTLSEPTPESETYPLGKDPILLTKMTFKDFDESTPQLVLEPEQGVGITFDYHPPFIKALMSVLSQAIIPAEWHLSDQFIHQMPENSTLQ